MSRYLVIVESPAKSSTIGRYLGSDYQVKSCYGHVRDLSKGKGSDIGVDPDKGWQARYEMDARQRKVISELSKAASGSQYVYLATDPDREGEAIAWHLSELLTKDAKKLPPEQLRRIAFNEITRSAVEKSIAAAGSLNMPLVEAQWSRRYLDRVVGYRLSPLLWKKHMRGASAGRVQSVALRLLVEREREIRAFVPKEYWQVKALLELDGQAVEFRLKRLNGKPFEAGSRKEADRHLKALKEHLPSAVLSERVDRPLSPRPNAPFITASLQRTASSRLSLDLRRTMRLAQDLYEAGHITYMRTDSTNLSAEAVAGVRKYITSAYASKAESYLPEQPRRYASAAAAQEGHEAIRPTRVDLPAERLPAGVDPAAKKLYDLIFRRFVACQMANAKLLRTRLRVAAGPYEFETEGLVTRFDGFLRVWPEGKGDEKQLPASAEGTAATCRQLNEEQKFTRPPRRFSQADLVRQLEKRGIGRPSTYAETVTTLQKRNYVHLERRRFFVEKTGELVCSRLEESFPELMDYDFTAGMEKDLDKVAAGQRNWRDLLDGFYRNFADWLDKATQEDGMRPVRRSVETELPCDKCGRPMALRMSESGLFLGCTGYSRKKEEGSCNATLNIVPVPRLESAETENEAEKEAENEAEKQAQSKGKLTTAAVSTLYRQCGKCSDAALPFQLDASRRLWLCGNAPDCDWTQLERGNYEVPAEDKAQTTGQAMQAIHLTEAKSSKYPDDHFVLRDSRNGLFLSASGFPKHKETRNITVQELHSVGEQLGEKHQFLLSAPTADPDGKATEVRFHRKTGQQYIGTAGLPKGTFGWAAFYDQQTGDWKEMAARKTSDKKPKAKGKKAARASRKSS